ncbi:hypothetical protein [Actinoplanes sp. NPDC026619]|uniref:hypothetical protein n=1 Tax=Actinoplanes sp. NPDC026619 TaxID=3155798 RepID=UPI0033E51300
MRRALTVALAAVLCVLPSTSAQADTATHVTFTKLAGGNGTCDPIDPVACLLPFPNDWNTRYDATSATGRRVNFTAATLPVNSLGATTNPDGWNRSDGFSPGSAVMTVAPGVSATRSGLAPITDIATSLSANAPAVLVDMTTGERWPYWAELDANTTNTARQALIIRPAKNFTPGHSYAVGLRNLVNSAGVKLAPSAAFSKVRGATLAASDALRSRQQQLEPVFGTLTAAGVARADLYLAWGFTVASEQNLTGDLAKMRDQSFANLKGAAPSYTLTSVTEYTTTENPQIARRIEGYVTVPNYLTLPNGIAGSTLTRGADGLPAVLLGRTVKALFTCVIPRTALVTPSNAALYGHGLLGSANEVTADNVEAMASEHNFTFCATPWIGMADDDTAVLSLALAGPSLFQAIPDRMRQGLLNAMFVGRAMTAAGGLTGNPAFQNAAGKPVIDTSAGLSYDGNSQGGIVGGALVASSPDLKYGVLGVTGMNYSLLLNRSSDFASFQQIIDVAFPDKLDQQVLLSLLQMQWDRGETNGYAATLAASPAKRVLMHVAFGDHQVANVSADVEARTLGARVPAKPLAAGRSTDVTPFWGINKITSYPYAGSAMVVWDSGTGAPPLTNTPPSEAAQGHDPHEDPRHDAKARQQKSVFMRTGTVVDVCNAQPCTAAPAE